MVTKLSKAIQRFTREDPTFRVFTDEETNETVIAGWRVAPRNLRRTHETRIRRRSRSRRAQGQLPRSPDPKGDYNFKPRSKPVVRVSTLTLLAGLNRCQKTAKKKTLNSPTRLAKGKSPRNSSRRGKKGFRDSVHKGRGPASRSSARQDRSQ